MQNVSYKSTIRGMLIPLLGKEDVYGWGDAPGDPDIEHALSVMTRPQLDRMYWLCKESKVEEIKAFVKELQGYQIRG